MRPSSRRLLSTLLLAALPVAAGCGGGDRLEKSGHSTLWVRSSEEVTLADLGRLGEVGIEEVFAEAAVLAWSAGGPELEPLPLLSLPRRLATTLVVRGEGPGAIDAEVAAPALASALEALVPQARRQGLEPVGFHLDLTADADLTGYAELLAALQESLEPSLYLSATVEHDWLERPGLEELADAVDFLVAFLYGQRAGSPDDIEAWHLARVETNLDLLEQLERDYLVGVVTIGRALLLDREDEIAGETSEITLGEMVDNPAFELSRGFTLEGVDRQVYRFHATSTTDLGGWRIRPGGGVRATFLGSHHLEEFARRVSARELPHRLGELFYRLPAPGEGLSLSIGNLLSALSPEVATAEVALTLTRDGGGGNRRRYRLEVVNESEEPTDVSLIGNNYVELAVEDGVIGRVDPGEFTRWELLAPGRDGELDRVFRNAPVLRLYLPLLDRGQRVASGSLEVIRRGPALAVAAGGSFILPDGRRVTPRLVDPTAAE